VYYWPGGCNRCGDVVRAPDGVAGRAPQTRSCCVDIGCSFHRGVDGLEYWQAIREESGHGKFRATVLQADSISSIASSSLGGRVWLWPDGNLGTAAFILLSGDDVVIVPVDVVGVAP
jgi:hypothetical protein